ncbi:ATP synthase F0 subunit B, partial [Candidatus Marinimicrobia bacterium]|nr:ATP synthase F0 subunit B [Candidatus Neomarinimicrobiota bacterium]
MVLTSFIKGTDQPKLKEWHEKIGGLEYYKYWNPYRRVLDLQSEPQTFYGQDYFEAKYNKDGRIKTVTRFGEDRKEQETYHFLWSKSGARSEYKVAFHTDGNAQRLDKYLYADQLSYIRPGWIADVKSRKDGRPSEVSFSDKLGFTYFYYHFNYSTHRDKGFVTEVVESSYFDTKGDFVGRHLLFWEGGDILRMIQYFDTENKIIRTIEFINNWKEKETIRVISNRDGSELERKIIPFMPPDKYAYKLEWTGKKIVDHSLLDAGAVAISLEYYKKTERALKEANQKVKEAKYKLSEAKNRANKADKILLKAKRNAKDLEQFQIEMEDAKKEATLAIESMNLAEKEAKDARLLALAAMEEAEKIKRAKIDELNAPREAKSSHKKSKKEAKEARKKEKEAEKLMKKAIRDSSDLGDKSFITIAYTTPFSIEPALQNHTAQTGYTIGLGRRDLFTIRDMDVNLGLEINWYDFESDTTTTTEENFQTLSYYLIAQLDPKFSWNWLPKNIEMGFKMGAGLISPGYGFTAGYSAVFNLSPTPLAIGIVTQFNWVANIT